MKLYSAIRKELGGLSRIERFELMATLIGLVVDSIALIGYLGITVAREEPSRALIGSDDFFVWVSIALTYSLGFVNSLVYKRWRRFVRWEASNDRDSDKRTANELVRRMSLAALTSYPVLFLYIRALQSAYPPVDEPGTIGTGPFNVFGTSAWGALCLSGWTICFVAPLIALVAFAFDKVISALAGKDG